MLSAGHSQARSAGATRVVALAALALVLLLALLALLLPGFGTAEGAEPGTPSEQVSDEPSSERSAPLDPSRGDTLEGPRTDANDAGAASDAESVPALPPGEIVGRVFDAKGAPLRAVQVRASLDPADDSAHAGNGVSDRDGWYRISRLPPGHYQLALRAAFESAGWTQLASVEVRSGETATVDLAYRGERTLRAAFEFAAAWEEMDRSMQTVLLRRADRREEVVARSFAFTRHEEPWCSGDVTFTGLEPGLYVLEVWPFVEDHQVWSRELDLTLADVDLEPQALHSDRVWRPRARLPPPEKRSLR
ncbi:MAG: carboxypeptidase-like regulatory domain-containing protein [Planctomycetota bacterium]|nr:carboxypeptidase-like regulatory domain-containing protein [Planctomycetota bacterium]